MFTKINTDLMNALKSGDKFKLSVLRMIKSALQLESINNKKELTDEVVISVLKRQVKQRNDSIKEYEELGKEEVVNDLKHEIEIINEYLPEEASDEEVQKVIDEAFQELNPTSMKDMGKVMKFVTEHLANADMSKVSTLVKNKLNS